MRILSSVACQVVPCTSELSHNRHDFRGGGEGDTLMKTKCVFWIPLKILSERFLILRRIWRDISVNVRRSPCRVPSFLSGFNIDWISNIKFHKNPSSGSQVVPWGRTDMTKLIVAFLNFANAPAIPRSAHTVYLCALCASENKQPLFLYTALTDWFL
jgi:hypothetical protein